MYCKKAKPGFTNYHPHLKLDIAGAGGKINPPGCPNEVSLSLSGVPGVTQHLSRVPGPLEKTRRRNSFRILEQGWVYQGVSK